MQPARHEIALATYNIHGCRGLDGRREPERIARVLAELDADVIALQEVFYPDEVDLECREPVLFPELERYAFVLGPTLRHRSDHYGNVLLARHPVLKVARLDLSMRRREPRGALDVTLDVGGTPLRIVATHLGLNWMERRAQVERLLAHLACEESPFTALLGDFNDWLPGRSVLRELEARLGRGGCPRSFPVRCPLLSLDRIWVHPRSALLEVRAHRSPAARRASDHLPVVARVALPEPPRAAP